MTPDEMKATWAAQKAGIARSGQTQARTTPRGSTWAIPVKPPHPLGWAASFRTRFTSITGRLAGMVGGRSRSPEKVAASRRNGRLGWPPRERP